MNAFLARKRPSRCIEQCRCIMMVFMLMLLLHIVQHTNEMQ